MLIVFNLDCFHHLFGNGTLKKLVNEILIAYPQSKFAIEKERPIRHQRCRGRPERPDDRSTYITFKWKRIKEATHVLGNNAPGSRMKKSRNTVLPTSKSKYVTQVIN